MKKIIIIEDESFLKFRLENVLIKHDFIEIETLDLKVMTLSYIANLVDNCELMIIDLDDHELDAIKLISEIRKIETNSQVPILALSITSEFSALEEAVSVGCTDFIFKPFEDESLIFKVKKLLGLDCDSKNLPHNIGTIKKVAEISEIMLTWSSDFEIGIKEIDSDHRSIIEKYEVLYELIKEGNVEDYYNELTTFLNDYVNNHFELDEILQENAMYELQEENADMNEHFKSSINGMIKEGRKKEATNVELIKINLYIKNWIIHHIIIDDRNFFAFLNSRKNEIYA